jgi:hypothetical protein
MKVYVITETGEASRHFKFTISDVRFAFTSKKKAMQQMDIIIRKMEQGEWWLNADGTSALGKVMKDFTTAKEIYNKNIREVLIEAPNGFQSIWRITELEANSGYGFEL